MYKSFKYLSAALLVLMAVTLAGCGNADKGWFYREDGVGTYKVDERSAKALLNEDAPKAGVPSGEIITVKGKNDEKYRAIQITLRLVGDFKDDSDATNLLITNGAQTLGSDAYVYLAADGGNFKAYVRRKNGVAPFGNLEALNWELDLKADIALSFDYVNRDGQAKHFELTVEASKI